jgi:hypothetical protein
MWLNMNHPRIRTPGTPRSQANIYFIRELLGTELVRLQRCISMANAFGDVVHRFMSGAYLDAMDQAEPILITAESNGRVHAQGNRMPQNHNMHGDEERNEQAAGYPNTRVIKVCSIISPNALPPRMPIAWPYFHGGITKRTKGPFIGIYKDKKEGKKGWQGGDASPMLLLLDGFFYVAYFFLNFARRFLGVAFCFEVRFVEGTSNGGFRRAFGLVTCSFNFIFYSVFHSMLLKIDDDGQSRFHNARPLPYC